MKKIILHIIYTNFVLYGALILLVAATLLYPQVTEQGVTEKLLKLPLFFMLVYWEPTISILDKIPLVFSVLIASITPIAMQVLFAYILTRLHFHGDKKIISLSIFLYLLINAALIFYIPEFRAALHA